MTEKVFQDQSDAIIINERYEWIAKLVALSVVDEKQQQLKVSGRIDRIVTHRVFAFPNFALVMWGIYFLAIQIIGGIGTDWMNDTLFGAIVPNYLQKLFDSCFVGMNAIILSGSA